MTGGVATGGVPIIDPPATGGSRRDAGVDAQSMDARTGGVLAMDAGVRTGGTTSACTGPVPGSKLTNPLFTTVFTADPAPFVHNCTFYITAGHDIGNQTAKFVMNDWFLLKSTDLVTWTKIDKALAWSNFKWANGNAWASQMVAGKDGKFYWYVPVNKTGSCPNNCGMAIGVASASSPEGPFTDAIGKPLIDDLVEMANWNLTLDSDSPFTIDPTVWVDDDGRVYMHYGSFGRMAAVELNTDMISLKGKIQYATPPRFFEAAFLIQRPVNGAKRYYEIYAADQNPAVILYSYSSSPFGPWTLGGTVIDKLPNVSGQDAATNHAGVIEFAGQWYIVYHVSDGPNGGGTYQRQVQLEKLNFTADGKIENIGAKTGKVVTF